MRISQTCFLEIERSEIHTLQPATVRFHERLNDSLDILTQGRVIPAELEWQAGDGLVNSHLHTGVSPDI